jgi:hypothetical protein
MRQHPRLARSGTCNYQQRPTPMYHRIQLIRVQRRQIQRVDIEQ